MNWRKILGLPIPKALPIPVKRCQVEFWLMSNGQIHAFEIKTDPLNGKTWHTVVVDDPHKP